MARGGGSNIGNPSGFARRMIREGMSGRGALRRFREAGGAMRDSVWQDLYRGVREGMSKAGRVADLPGHRIPGIDDFTPWRAGQGGKYAYQITVTTRDVGTDDLIEHEWTIMSDRPMSINKAEQEALQQAEEGAENGAAYENEKVISAQVKGLFRTIGQEE